MHTATKADSDGEHDEQAAIGAICVMAAFADGTKSEVERARIRAILDGLGGDALAGVYQRVLLQQTTLEAEATRLRTAAARQLAYEMAVCVCDADGESVAAERAFLERLRVSLGLDGDAAVAVRVAADAMVTAGDVPPPTLAPSAPAVAGAPGEGAEGMIRNYAVLTGGLELLPQSMASLAIIPLQMKMVYRIGAQHGAQLDRTQVTELLGALGVGLTGQVIEGFARKLLGGLLRKAGGKMAGTVGATAVGAAGTFATTYAIGQVAQAYYGGGRRLDGGALKRLFAEKSGEAQGLYQQYRGEIESRSRSINLQELLPMIRGA